jgi:hypothetical protein
LSSADYVGENSSRRIEYRLDEDEAFRVVVAASTRGTGGVR